MEGIFCSMAHQSSLAPPPFPTTPFLEELRYLNPAKFFYCVLSLPPQWQFTFSEETRFLLLKNAERGIRKLNGVKAQVKV